MRVQNRPFIYPRASQLVARQIPARRLESQANGGIWNHTQQFNLQQRQFGADLEAKLAHGVMHPDSLLRRPADIFAMPDSSSIYLDRHEAVAVLAFVWTNHAKAVESKRIETLRTNHRAITARQRAIGLDKIRDPELEALQATDYQDTYALTLELFAAKTLSVVFAAQNRLLDARLPTTFSEVVKSKKRVEIPFVTVPVLGDVPIVRFERSTKTVSLWDEVQKALTALLDLHVAGANLGVAAGPEYNRGQKTLLDAARKYVEAANAQLPRKDRIVLDSIFTGEMAPFKIPLPPKPDKMTWLERATSTFVTYADGGPMNRARHIVQRAKVNPTLPEAERYEIPLLTQRTQLPPGVPFWDRQTLYRMWVDRRAKKLADEYLTYGGTNDGDLARYVEAAQRLGWDSPAMISWLHREAGGKMCTAGHFDVTLEYAPGAEELCRRLSEKFNRVLYVGTHTGTSDTFILQRGLPGSSLDKMFGGRAGAMSFIARADYDKDSFGTLAYPAMDQRGLYGVSLVSDGDRRANLALCDAIAKGRHAVLYAAGGRHRYYWLHNPFVEGGLGAFGANADLIIPVAERNSTGEEFRGGHASVVVGRPAVVSEYGVEGKKIKRIKDIGPLAHYLWQEQKRMLFVPA